MVRQVIEGLSSTPRTLPTQYLYDAKGSELFERITHLPEYYLTRTEMSIFDDHLDDMAAAMGSDVWLIELGSGAGTKTLRLLQAMREPAGYTPIEISKAALDASLDAIQTEMPGLDVQAVCGDFTHDLNLPETPGSRRVVFFPGSTIGNLGADASRALLRRLARWVGPGGGLLIGVDLIKSPDLLVPAYDDAAGITAAFNLNLLDRLNREAGADFDRQLWEHRAVWNKREARMESYLVSTRDQEVHLAGRRFAFSAGEAVWTEQSQKYSLASLMALAQDFSLREHWTDDRSWCAMAYLEVSGLRVDKEQG
ncbi:Histidine-specific methyltransferase EgtD [Mucisphaera calidilacus]|uniref:Histidine-specific methyltransferase EgtD n=2 Tax=Mucisphaera calidilacus TaxID=2527982 RepID=A0A518BUC7_9BACT|nr:Histidine-specific methyltransferase EgtD [Mucisphaera calidilacus]